MGNNHSIRFSAYKVNQADNPKKLYKNFLPQQVETLNDLAEIAKTHALCVQRFKAEPSKTSGGFKVPYRRATENIDAYGNIILVDVDEGDISPYDMMFTLDHSGYAYVLFESMSSTPANPKYHIIFLSDCESSHTEYADRYKQFAKELDLPVDMAMKNSVALMAPSFKDPIKIQDGKPVPFSTYETRTPHDAGDVDETITEHDITATTPKEDIVKALEYIDPDSSYKQWLDVGMELHSWSPDSKGLELWDEWSKSSKDYNRDEIETKWKSFKRKAGGLTIKTLFATARENGYGFEGVSPEYAAELRERYAIEAKEFNQDLLDVDAILAYIDNSFYIKDRVYWVRQEGRTVNFKDSDISTHFKKVRNPKLTYKKRRELENKIILEPKELESREAHPTKVDRAISDWYKQVYKNILSTIKYRNTVETVNYKINPFAKRCGVIIDPNMGGRATVVYNTIFTYVPEKVVNPKIVELYRKHFPEIDDLMDMLVQVRMGAETKGAYLWFNAETNFGKSFLFKSIFGSNGLNLFYPMTMGSLTKLIKGTPSGEDPVRLSMSWGIFVDEIYSVPRDVLDMTHSIIVNQKGKNTVEVPILFKVFASHDSVPTLEDDSLGVEEQKANRFMKITGKGSLDKVFEDYNMKEVYQTLLRWVYEELKKRIDKYVALGEHDAELQAMADFKITREKYSIKNKSAGDLVENVRRVIEDFLISIKERNPKVLTSDLVRNYITVKDGHPGWKDKIFIEKRRKFFEDFKNEYFGEDDLRILRGKSFTTLFEPYIENANVRKYNRNGVKTAGVLLDVSNLHDEDEEKDVVEDFEDFGD